MSKNSSHHIKRIKSSSKSLLAICSIILILLVGVSVYFIVENEQSKNKPSNCNRAKGYVWSSRLKKCVKGYGN